MLAMGSAYGRAAVLLPGLVPLLQRLAPVLPDRALTRLTQVRAGGGRGGGGERGDRALTRLTHVWAGCGPSVGRRRGGGGVRYCGRCALRHRLRTALRAHV